MKKTALKFSIGYDSFVYKTEDKYFNIKFVGELQLLSFLERELGLTGKFKSTKDRQSEYLKFLTKEIVEEDKIYNSFNNDKIGVSNEILKWRDQLKLCNYDFSKIISKRLDILNRIEKNYDLSLGVSDRWILVLNNLNNNFSINLSKIEIFDSIDLLHPIYKKIFSLLKEKNVEVVYKKINIENKKNNNLQKIKNAIVNNVQGIDLEINDNSFQILKFKDSVVSADFLSQQLLNNSFNPIIINKTNFGLDTSLSTFKIPLSGSEITNANPQIIQLFKLISSLLFSNVNPYNLLSLLKLPMLPFPKSLANQLAKVLIETAGINNEQWNRTISNFKENNDKEEKLKIIKFYLERERKEKVSKNDLIDIYRQIGTWASQRSSIVVSESGTMQLFNLKNLAKTFINMIENVDEDEFTPREIEMITSKIYETISIKANGKEKGSKTVLNCPEQLYSNAEETVWFDFYNDNLSVNFCSFLMQSEIDVLVKQANILFWKKENQIKFQLENLQKGILKTTNKIVLFIVEKNNGNITTEHPIYTQLSSSINNLDNFIYDFSFDNNDWNENFDWMNIEVTESEKIELPKEIDYLQLKNHALLNKRDTESYSSVNELIQNPFDWVMNYQTRITEKGLGNINELFILKGNLSHEIIQILLEKQKEGEIDFATIDVDKEIESLLEILTPQIASPFYLEENVIEYKEFVNQLKKSFKVLQQIIENNDLKYRSSEYEAEGKIEAVDFFGKIDLLFYKKEKPVIIDLKWTFSFKKYATLLEDEKAIQLAMYSKLLENSSAITAYFLLSDAILLTTNSNLLGKNVRLVKIEDAHDVNNRMSEKMMKSYNYRWKELKEGKIEIAEEMLLEEIQYHLDVEKEYLIALDVKDRKFKKSNPYSSYTLFKGNVK